MNNKPILFEDKMKYKDNEFLYDKCIKQHDCIMRYQWKMCEYKYKLKEKDKEIERLQQIIDKAIDYLTDPTKEFSEDCYYKICETVEAEDLLNILKGSEE